MSEEIYTQSINCWNCGNNEIVHIPKGTTISKFNDENACSKCGCHRRLK